MTLYKDDDGTAYLVSSANENADLDIFRLTADYTGIDSLVANPWPGTYREAPALFKRSGDYLMLTSANSGWKPNQQRYATATSFAGPWTAMTEVGNDTAYGSQTAYVLPIQGTSGTSYLSVGSQYAWLPLTFPTRMTMDLPWYPQIAIGTAAATVTGVGGGPYYNLVARHSGKCLDMKDASTANGARIIQWPCGTGSNQQLWLTIRLHGKSEPGKPVMFSNEDGVEFVRPGVRGEHDPRPAQLQQRDHRVHAGLPVRDAGACLRRAHHRAAAHGPRLQGHRGAPDRRMARPHAGALNFLPSDTG